MPTLRTKSGRVLPNLGGFFPHFQRRWLLVASSTDAVLFEQRTKYRFRVVQRLENPEGRKKERDLDSDRPGRGFSSASSGTFHHALDRRYNRREKITRSFARHICEVLKKAAHADRYTALSIVAEPRFLGILRKRIPVAVQHLIKSELNEEFRSWDYCRLMIQEARNVNSGVITIEIPQNR